MAVLTLEETKQYLRVDSADEDDFISGLIETGENLCADVARMEISELEAHLPMARIAVLYATACLGFHIAACQRSCLDGQRFRLHLPALLIGLALDLGAACGTVIQEEMKKAVITADSHATVEADGAIKWNRNGRYLMDDFCEKLEYAGYPFSREATARKRDAQNEESIAEYRRNHKGLSGEALAEARAAFGEGTTVVNILTGERTTL